MVLIYSTILLFEVGYFIFVVPLGIAATVAIQMYLQEWFLVTIRGRGAATDEKNLLTEESIKGIKMVKLNAWEEVVRNTLYRIRARERNIYKTLYFIQSVLGGMAAFLPHLSALAIFILYIIFRPGELTVAKIFSILANFGAIISPIRQLMFARITKTYADLGGARTLRILRIYNY